MSNYLKDMNNQKLAKVNEAAKIVQPTKYDRPEKKEAVAPKAAPGPNKAPMIKKPTFKGKIEETENSIVPGKVKGEEELPVGGKGGYNLDNLSDDAFGNSGIGKPKGKPPARFAKKEETKVEEEERPIKQALNIDDMPIGNKGTFDQAMEEDMPIKRGAYNLDALGADAFGGDSSIDHEVKPKKNIPARFAQKPKTEPIIDDEPIKKAKMVDDRLQASGDIMMDENDIQIPKKGYDLDALGDEAFGGQPSKKAPPSRFTAKKPTTDGDDEMKEEQQQIAVKKPFPSKVKTAVKEETKAAVKPAGAKGPQIQEENAGEGLSKEEAEAKVYETFPPDLVGLIADDKKWNEKVEGFKGIGASMQLLQLDAVVIEAVVKFTKMRLKDWKESNINLIKEAIALFTVIATSCDNLTKRSVFVMMPFLSDKLGDVKMVNPVHELLLSLSESVTPKYVGLQLLKYGAQAKAPNAIKETCNILAKMTDEFGSLTMPLKEMIDFAIVSVNNSNPQVRVSSMALFAMLYKHAGDTVKNFIKDVKESTMKLIDEELNKVTPYLRGEYQRKRNFKGEAAFEEKASGPSKKGGAGGLDDMFPRTDISKQLTPKLMPLFGDNDWKKRKEAADKVEEILKAANMRIQPVGLNELWDKIKQRMTDANKAVVKAYMQLICILVEALGSNAKQFAKKILPSMLQNLADKQTLVRGDAVTAMDKWAKECGAELIISIGGPMVGQDNPELRTEMLGWIIKNKEAIKLVQLDQVKEFAKPLVDCLSDKTLAIRTSAEEVITAVMPIVGYSAFQTILSNMKPAVVQSIKPVLEKIKAKLGDFAPAPQNQLVQSIGIQPQNIVAQSQKPAPVEKPVAGPTLKASVVQQQQKPQIKPKEQPNISQLSQANESKMNQSLNSSLSQRKEVMQTPSKNQSLQMKPSTIPQASTGPRLKNPMAQSVSNFKPVENLDISMSQSDILVVNLGQKDKRGEWDRKNKFQIEDFKQDQIERLRNQAHFAFGPQFTAKLFSHEIKQHCECIEAFKGLMDNQVDFILEILDLIFKWTVIRMADSSNTTFGIKIFDYYAILFQFLQQTGYMLLDFEASVLVPLLCEKTGINNNILKEKVKKLLKMCLNICDKQTVYNHLITQGLNSKNQNAIAGCLEEIAEFINVNGIDYSNEKEMRMIAKMADSTSKDVRENALQVLGEAFKHLQDNIWRVIGAVTPKVQGLLEARFKKLKGGHPLAASASMQNFHTARPQTALNQNDQLASSLGLKGALGLQQKHGLQSGVKGPTLQQQPTTARNNLVLQRSQTAFKPTSEPSSEQQDQEEVKQKLQRMSLNNQPNQPTSIVNPQDVIPSKTSSLASKLKPLNQQVEKTVPIQQEQKIIYPPQTLLQEPEDDDEDLRILSHDMGFFDNPQQDKLLEDIKRHIHFLKYADLSKRVDSLVSVNEMICNMNEFTAPVLQQQANDLIEAFVYMMKEMFEVAVENLNLKFAKYFISIVMKTCLCRDIMMNLGYDQVYSLTQQLLTRLLIDGLDRLGENKEGELILKNLNSSMLRILENCNHTFIICALFDLQTYYYNQDQLQKLPNLIIKCLLKLSKVIEKMADQLDIGRIFQSMHKYLLLINHENKSPNDEMGIKTAKTIINEFVKIKKESIWEAYNVVRAHHLPDQHIIKWIQIVLRSLQQQAVGPSAAHQYNPSPQDVEAEIVGIIQELRSPDKFEANLPRLYTILQHHPEVQIQQYINSCSITFQKFLKNRLEEYIKGQADYSHGGPSIIQPTDSDEIKNSVLRRNQVGNNGAFNSQGGQQQQRQSMPPQMQSQQIPKIESTNNLERLQQMKMRMSLMRKGGEGQPLVIGGETPSSNKNENAGNGGMNTSFNAMNNSLSQKWISKQTQIRADPSQQNAQPNIGEQNLQQVSNAFDHGQMHQSIGSQQPQANQNQSVGLGGGRAQQSDLNNRLAEMKAKLAALKNNKQ